MITKNLLIIRKSRSSFSNAKKPTSKPFLFPNVSFLTSADAVRSLGGSNSSRAKTFKHRFFKGGLHQEKYSTICGHCKIYDHWHTDNISVKSLPVGMLISIVPVNTNFNPKWAPKPENQTTLSINMAKICTIGTFASLPEMLLQWRITVLHISLLALSTFARWVVTYRSAGVASLSSFPAWSEPTIAGNIVVAVMLVNRMRLSVPLP